MTGSLEKFSDICIILNKYHIFVLFIKKVNKTFKKTTSGHFHLVTNRKSGLFNQSFVLLAKLRYWG